MQKIYLIFLLFFIVILLFSGCIDAPVAPVEYTISGNILPTRLYAGGYLISAGEYPIVSSASDGSFKVSTTAFPYNLIVTEYDYWFYYSRFVLKFKNISIQNPVIYYETFPFFENHYSKVCSIIVFFPALNNLKNITCKFISDKNFYQNPEPFFEESETDSVLLHVNIPQSESEITGRFIFFEASVDEYFNITSFDKFGTKYVTLRFGQNSPVTFEDSELTNPEETTVYTSINLNNEFGYYHSNVSLAFKEGSKENDIKIKNILNSPDNAVIPLLNKQGYKTKLCSYYINEMAEFGYISVSEVPGENLNLTPPQTVTLTLPADNSVNINDNTIFEVEDEELNSVYEFIIMHSNTLKYYTTEKSVKFSEFKARLFTIIPNREYYWCVKKYHGFSSLNEFLSKPFVYENPVEISGMKKFKTAP